MDYTQQNLPLLDFQPQDFDYADYTEFIQDEDIDYLAEESSASNPSNSLMAAATAGAATSQQQQQQQLPLPNGPALPSSSMLPVLASSGGGGNSPGASSGTSPPKQRLERRGHTKSRRGCYNCKRRRIKCQENRPACGHCVKTGLKCEYPAVPQVVHQPQHQIPMFSLQDMRFFQHFLLKCYPHQPLGNDSIWTHEIPCLSQEYDFLMHAVLGLAASDLMRNDPSLLTAAMSHRLKAIKAVKKALAEGPRRSNSIYPSSSSSSSSGSGNGSSTSTSTFSNEGNALLATCYALTFQSVMLDDGMAEFMTFIRGIVIVAIQMYMKGARFLFNNFIEDDREALLRPLLDKVPPVAKGWADDAAAAVRALAPLCEGDEVAFEYHMHLVNMADQMSVSSFGAYKALAKHYGWWMQISHERFRHVVDPENQLFVLLAAHWIAIKLVMKPITEVEQRVSKAMRAESSEHSGGGNRRRGQEDGRPDRALEGGLGRWLIHLNSQVDDAHQPYNGWPIWVAEQLTRDPDFFGGAITC